MTDSSKQQIGVEELRRIWKSAREKNCAYLLEDEVLGRLERKYPANWDEIRSIEKVSK